eukprot:TRINITY_DN340_c0_g4_i1.p1 TRINITY_DN340_c0_g4~~TRINITY_DN340_c0_g4_i1.p1  ORF type:complete len:181 (-),score=31.15 TRINITY_DN340_c0_g4_i1:12-554(-)
MAQEDSANAFNSSSDAAVRGASDAAVTPLTPPPQAEEPVISKPYHLTAAEFGHASFHVAARTYELTKQRTLEAIARVKEMAEDSEKKLAEQHTGGVSKSEVYLDVAKILASVVASETCSVARASVKLAYDKTAELKDPEKREIEKNKVLKDWNEFRTSATGFFQGVADEWKRLGQTPIPS